MELKTNKKSLRFILLAIMLLGSFAQVQAKVNLSTGLIIPNNKRIQKGNAFSIEYLHKQRFWNYGIGVGYFQHYIVNTPLLKINSEVNHKQIIKSIPVYIKSEWKLPDGPIQIAIGAGTLIPLHKTDKVKAELIQKQNGTILGKPIVSNYSETIPVTPFLFGELTIVASSFATLSVKSVLSNLNYETSYTYLNSEKVTHRDHLANNFTAINLNITF